MIRLSVSLKSLPALLFWSSLALCLWLPIFPSPSAAQEADGGFKDLETELSELAPQDLEELLVFVAGNALFTVYHEGGHMLVSELELPVLAQEEDAADNLATVSMLADDTGNTDLLLTNAMIGWFLFSEHDDDFLTFYGDHDLDRQRGYRMLCLMVGADEDAFLELALDLGLPRERIESCAFDYEQVAGSWDYATEPYLRQEDTPSGKITVAHDPPPEGLETLAVFLKETGILERVAGELDTLYTLPHPVTFRAASCGEANAFWDPDKREAVFCHELLAGFAALYFESVLPDE
ncbi:DUF4344 domain-containing metallopeptidase [Roseibium aggregatum]|uniref:Uncharacterized protein n=1 Tax=Roseibium aggregatum TaxID=187304 RepID=A0A939J3U4_9HYPH|nr:DUF4344 domain-containing metallopeptidase [Roseibium aggregatum]MBN9670019.1 hypothetical protein [Roseibium aggregatum]